MKFEIKSFLRNIAKKVTDKFPYAKITIADEPFQNIYHIVIAELFENDFDALNELHKELHAQYYGEACPSFILYVEEIIEREKLDLSFSFSLDSPTVDYFFNKPDNSIFLSLPDAVLGNYDWDDIGVADYVFKATDIEYRQVLKSTNLPTADNQLALAA